MGLHYNSFIPQLGKHEVHMWLLSYLEKKINTLDINSDLCSLSVIFSLMYLKQKFYTTTETKQIN